MNWIDAQKGKPAEGQKVLMKILHQRFVGGTHCEDEVVVVGGIKGGDWFVGSDMMLWDYDYNLGFSDDDVVEWVSLEDIKSNINPPITV